MRSDFVKDLTKVTDLLDQMSSDLKEDLLEGIESIDEQFAAIKSTSSVDAAKNMFDNTSRAIDFSLRLDMYKRLSDLLNAIQKEYEKILE